MLHSPRWAGSRLRPCRTPPSSVSAGSGPGRPRPGSPRRLEDGEHAEARRAFVAARETFIDGRPDRHGPPGRDARGRSHVAVPLGGQPRRAPVRGPLVAGRPHARPGGGATRGQRRAPPGCARVLTHFAADLITADYFRGFLRREPARALRLLTTKESDIQRRYVAVVEALVRRELGDQPFGAPGQRARPGLPAGPHLRVVHVRRPHHGRRAERRAGPGGLRAGAAAMTYPHRAPFATRWNDNDVYGHLNNTVYYEAMDTTINVWLIAVGGLDPSSGEPIGVCVSSSCEFHASASFPERSRSGCASAASGPAASRGSSASCAATRRSRRGGSCTSSSTTPRDGRCRSRIASAARSREPHRLAYRPGGMHMPSGEVVDDDPTHGPARARRGAAGGVPASRAPVRAGRRPAVRAGHHRGTQQPHLPGRRRRATARRAAPAARATCRAPRTTWRASTGSSPRCRARAVPVPTDRRPRRRPRRRHRAPSSTSWTWSTAPCSPTPRRTPPTRPRSCAPSASSWPPCSPSCTRSTRPTSGSPTSGAATGTSTGSCGAGATQLDGSRSRPVPTLDDLQERLAEHVPATARSSIVHGDYRLDNALVGRGRHTVRTSPRSSTGRWRPSATPLVDLGMLGLYWHIRDVAGGGGVAPSAVDPAAGYPQFDELRRRLLRPAGPSVPALGWYRAFAAYKLAVILEGIHFRYLGGDTVGEGFDRIGALVEPRWPTRVWRSWPGHADGLRPRRRHRRPDRAARRRSSTSTSTPPSRSSTPSWPRRPTRGGPGRSCGALQGLAREQGLWNLFLPVRCSPPCSTRRSPS